MLLHSSNWRRGETNCGVPLAECRFSEHLVNRSNASLLNHLPQVVVDGRRFVSTEVHVCLGVFIQLECPHKFGAVDDSS